MKARRLITLAALGALACPPALSASLDMDEARELALERDEELAALEAEIRGQREQAVADGALPDPEVGVGYMNLPVDSFSTSEDMMTQFQLTARQRFPSGRTRELSSEIGETMASVSEALADARRREVTRETADAWVRWAYAGEMLSVAENARNTFEEYVENTRSRYARGIGTQRDVTRAQLELSALEERVLELELEYDDAAARLGRWTGPTAVRGVEPGSGEVEPPPTERMVRDMLAEHPAVRVEALRTEAGELNVDRTRQRYRPEWMVEVGYGFRRAEDAAGDQASDMVSGMVGLSVPLFTRNRQDRETEAARESARAAAHRRGDTLNALDGRLERGLAAEERYTRLTELYEDRLIEEVSSLVELKFDAYRLDQEDFRELIRSQVDELDYRLRLLRIERDRAVIRAELQYLVGETS